MRREHPILRSPYDVPNEGGELNVMLQMPEGQADSGEALTLDTLVNSIDAELIATGPSAKGPNRGAITRHGRYLLWSFEGPVSKMTKSGRRLFVNTICYAAEQKDSPVLEWRTTGGTRDELFESLEYAKRVPGYLQTMKGQVLPKDLEGATREEVEKWVVENRRYLYRVEGDRRFLVDALAKRLGVANHKKQLLEKCIELLGEEAEKKEALETLVRYTGRKDLGASAAAWEQWLAENRDYLFFSDCDGYRFKIDEVAKQKGIPTEKLRGWSSETIDYRYRPDEKATP